MKNSPLESIPIIPEQYDPACYNRVDYSLVNIEMSETERRFVNGLVRYYEPENIIEIGVSRGGGSVNLLNAIIDRPESHLVSIDRLAHYYGDKTTPAGSDVKAVYPDISPEKWSLIAGYEPSTVLESLARKYDFAVIDTTHCHPMESLNFLCILPFLNDGAIVILHDVALHLYNPPPFGCATRILMSSVAGHKLTHLYEEKEQNIVAFQVTPDTRKYIDNIFDSLFLLWPHLIDDDDIEAMRKLFVKYYTASQIEKFDRAYEYARTYIASGGITYFKEELKELWDRVSKCGHKVIFYGVSNDMRNILAYFRDLSIPFNFLIWDRNADVIGDIYGYDVTNPDFTGKCIDDTNVVVTLRNRNTANEIKKRLEFLGYKTYISIPDFMNSVNQ